MAGWSLDALGLRWLAAVALLAVLGVACSGSDSESAQDPPAGEGAASEAETDGSVAPAGDGSSAVEGADPEGADPDGGDPERDDADDGEPEWFTPYEERVYPLSAFIGELEADLFPEQHAAASEPMVAIEEKTLECMTEQGFRYEVVDWAAIDAEYEAAMPSVSDEEIMTTGGYGFADSLGVPQVIESSYVDPNDAIKAGLSASELEAWEQYYAVCAIRANAWFDSPGIVHSVLWEDRQALRARIDADPRVAEAQAGWSECMAEHGHSYVSQDEIGEYLDGIAGPLQERLRALGGHEHIDAAFQADLDALLAIEVEIAAADVACSKRLDQVVYEATVDHQQRFVDENEDRLALLREELPTMTVPIPSPEDYWQNIWGSRGSN